MKIKLILLMLTIASVIADTKWSIMSKRKLSNANKRPAYLLKTPEDKRKLLIFPKSTQKYVVYSSLQPNTSLLKKPVDNKITRTLIGSQTEETTSRNNKHRLSNLNAQRNDFVANHEEKESRQEFEIDEPIDSSEKSRTDPGIVDKPSSVIQNGVVKDDENNLLKRIETTTKETLLKSYVKNDKEQNDVPVQVTELLEGENAEEKSILVRGRRDIEMVFLPVEKNEIPTEYSFKEDTNFKSKRSIIEEENLASTVSGFKFTGVPEHGLINKLNYNNINE